MKVLLLAHFYFDLYKPIYEELRKQGCDVVLIQDDYLPFDYNHVSEHPLKKTIKRAIRKVSKVEKKHWDKQFSIHPELCQTFDVLFIIQGLSFCDYLLKKLKTYNPGIKVSLYAWDTAKYYNFFRNNHLINKVFSFDVGDCENNPNVKLLPSFWVPTSVNESKYAISMIGSDHDDRIEIISKIVPQLESNELNYFFKVVSIKPKKENSLLFWQKNNRTLLSQWEEKQKLSFVTDSPIPVNEVMHVIEESDCILDTDMPIQTGATERVIWSLARGKKVISTNTFLKSMSFYNPEQIYIIDRNNPIIDFEWLTKPISYFDKTFFDSIRIDNWVKNFICF